MNTEVVLLHAHRAQTASQCTVTLECFATIFQALYPGYTLIVLADKQGNIS